MIFFLFFNFGFLWSATRIISGIIYLALKLKDLRSLIYDDLVKNGDDGKTVNIIFIFIFFICLEVFPIYFSLEHNLAKTFIKDEPSQNNELLVQKNEVNENIIRNSVASSNMSIKNKKLIKKYTLKTNIPKFQIYIFLYDFFISKVKKSFTLSELEKIYKQKISEIKNNNKTNNHNRGYTVFKSNKIIDEVTINDLNKRSLSISINNFTNNSIQKENNKCQRCKYGYFKTKDEKCVLCSSEKSGGHGCSECTYEKNQNGEDTDNIICKGCYSLFK